MDKNKVLEIFYETIKDSMQWALEDESFHYAFL